MINRTMVRTRVVQTLFAYYQMEDSTLSSARKSLQKSYEDLYALYIHLFGFANELVRYAEQQMEESRARAKATHTTYMPDRRFLDNRFVHDLFVHHELRHWTEEYRLSWDAGMNAVINIYRMLQTQPFFHEYMKLPETTYEDDRRLFRRIYQVLLPNNESVHHALEEMEIALDRNHWSTDFEVILSYVIKTMKQFKQEGDEPKLLPMFESEEELQFGLDLMQKTIENREAYSKLIDKYLRNWEADRVAYMDRIIMLTALTEILCFPNIALEISLNEYIEIAKEYSSEKSHIFINGILDNILKEQNITGVIPAESNQL
ncbi:MAG: transcription antitermination factor NusB [Paludibacteraceae bacterium]|nr:transcription antitermination factor NusB [Paludibacteraceae bacterium]